MDVTSQVVFDLAPSVLMALFGVVCIILLLIRFSRRNAGQLERQEERLSTREKTSDMNAKIEEDRASQGASEMQASLAQINSQLGAMKSAADAVAVRIALYDKNHDPEILRQVSPQVSLERKMMETFRLELEEYNKKVISERKRLEAFDSDIKREGGRLLQEQGAFKEHLLKTKNPHLQLNIKGRMKQAVDVMSFNLAIFKLSAKESGHWKGVEGEVGKFISRLSDILSRLAKSKDVDAVAQAMKDYGVYLSEYKAFSDRTAALGMELQKLLSEQQAIYEKKQLLYAAKEELEKEYHALVLNEKATEQAGEKEVTDAAA